MAIVASTIIDAAQELVQDVSGVGYTTAQGLVWINKGQRAIVNLRRDAGALTESWLLAAGAKQTLGSGRIQLLGDLRNMGTDGSTPGNAIRLVTDRKTLDAIDPSWSADANQAAAIDEYTYDIDNPTVFYVNPPNDGTGYIEGSVVKVPADLALESDNITISDLYEMALIYFVCWYWLGRDDERSPNYTRAQAYKASYYEALDISNTAKRMAQPEVNNV